MAQTPPHPKKATQPQGRRSGRGRGSERSYAPFTDEHLKRLVKIAHEDQESLFERNPHLAVYRDRLLLVALCQGGRCITLLGVGGRQNLNAQGPDLEP